MGITMASQLALIELSKQECESIAEGVCPGKSLCVGNTAKYCTWICMVIRFLDINKGIAKATS